MQGPNVRKLIVHKMSLDAIPKNSQNGLADGIAFLSDTKRIVESARAAQLWVAQAIDLIRMAKDGDAEGNPNPWRESSDEDIAGCLLTEIENRKN